jgi:integrase
VSPSKRRTHTSVLRRDVIVWAAEQEAAIARGDWRDPKLARTTFEAWAERWWAARVVEPEGARDQRYSLDLHVLPHWRGWTLGSIGRLEVQSWIATMQRSGTGPAAVGKAYGLFRAAMLAAVAEELIGRTPCRDITLPTVAVRQPRYFEVDQVAAIVGQLPEPHATVALVMAWCGLRWEEAAGLEVAAVRTLRRELSVEQVVTSMRRLKPYAKDTAVHRTVPAPQHVLDRLAGPWRVAAGREPYRQPRPDGKGFTLHRLLFRAPDGRPLNSRTWSGCWGRALAKLPDVPRFTPHTLRHTAASWWVQGGVDLYEVQRLLGHSKADTAQIYAHLRPGVHRNVREAWAALLDTRDARPTHAGGGER